MHTQTDDADRTSQPVSGRLRIEGVDWSTGRPAFHFVLGGSMFNTLGAGITLDEEGRLLLGTIFGKTRILRVGTNRVPSAVTGQQ